MPRRLASTLAAGLLLALVATAPCAARQGGLGPGVPIGPLPGQKDWQLYDKAVRLQRRMWWHISPDGVLVHEHRQGADPARLQHDATLHPDIAIWTGCYAASQACRWAITRDPDALEQCRALARGLAALSDVTGVGGALARNLGRLIPGEEIGKLLEPSPSKPGYHFRFDPSRDSLAGWTMGWAFLYLYVDDPEVRELAKKTLPPVAGKLYGDKMWIRDPRGGRTEYGELRPDVEGIPFLKNGPFAAIGLAPIIVAAAIRPETGLGNADGELRRKGWHSALPEQIVFLSPLVNASNVNMANLALTTITLYSTGRTKRLAQEGLEQNRRATVGWWNAGFCACQLLGGLRRDREGILAECRRVLHDQTEEEAPPGCPLIYDLDRITTIAEKGPQSWAWADNVRRIRKFAPWVESVPPYTYTRADWLFAYWLARAAGELRPLVGPGADPTSARIEPDLPPWMAPPR